MSTTARTVAQPPGRLSSLILGFLPRVADRPGLLAAALGGAALLVAAASGAALVHVLEYHLALGGGATARAIAADMRAHCPLNGGLLVVLLFAFGTIGLCAREVRLLMARRRALATTADRAGLAPMVQPVQLPRRPGRRLRLFLSLFILQAGIFLLSAHFWPMGGWMRMGGIWMYMAPSGALPALPLHGIVAALLTLLIWKVEYRLRVLTFGIAALARRLRRWLAMCRGLTPLAPVPPARRIACLGLRGLSRPPPLRF
ncbi:MAG TPA: hypothetical protein VNL71_23275 [Chloroflexota bacterium]|nr:hypothetical protein [Chloroflexota bacterium]